MLSRNRVCFKKMFSWNWEKLKTGKHGFFNRRWISLCFYFTIFFFGGCIYAQFFFDTASNKSSSKKYPQELIKKINSLWKKYVKWTCFKVWLMIKNFPKTISHSYHLFTKLPIVSRYFSPAFSDSKEVSYLPWQNKYSNLKTT